MAGKREEGDREEESGSCGGGDGVIWGDGEGAASPQASSSAHITLPNCHCPLRHLHPPPPHPHTPNHPPSPALPPSILDRMINGVSVHASATVPVYTKHYHNFFFFIFLL